MCIGEKRTLTIGPDYGYGQRSVGPIPAGSTLGTPPAPPLYLIYLVLTLHSLFPSLRDRAHGHRRR